LTQNRTNQGNLRKAKAIWINEVVEHLDRDRAAVGGTEQAVDDLQRAAVAVQLGGSDPLAHCARIAEDFGYDEVVSTNATAQWPF
jgi:tRNA-dihydrouridine synthase